jgi:long-chain acyl-CoA synthetase
MNNKSALGSRPPRPPSPLSLTKTFAGARLVVIGGTGFLGKVWWVLMLDRFPDLERLYLVVRARPGQTAEQRFYQDIAKSECLEPLRRRHGADWERFLRSKVTVVDGDIVKPWCGIGEAVRDELRGTVSAVVNASGIVDFQPPLDIALEVNAFGMQSLIQLARDLGNVPVMHTSTCYVAGNRPGIVEEVSPLDHPFPYAGKLDRELWDPDREIAECLDIIEQAKHRANDAFRESHFLDVAKKNLVAAGEPAKGAVLEAEVARVRRKFVEAQLAGFGQERAKFWGWPNTYTYTKSIGEQIVAKSGLPFTIVRPAIVESCVEFPLVGWNEGVNTSAPLIFAVREGQFQFPGAAIRLDIIPCDMVATGITLALAELLDGSQKPVYQFGTSDSNPTTMARIYELSGLYKRRHWTERARGNSVERFFQVHLEGALMPTKSFERIGPRAVSKGASLLADWLDFAPRGPVDDMLAPTKGALRRISRQQSKIADVVGQFAPFTADLDYEFRCDNTRAANARLSEAERESLYWRPERLDWRAWFLEVHVPGLERWVFPELEKRLQRPLRPLQRYESLNALLEEMAERHGLAVALQHTEADGLSRVSYREWLERSEAVAARLAAHGVTPGQRVILAARNHPNWAIAFFGALLCGAVVVPLSPDQVPDQRALELAGARLALLDEAALTCMGDALRCPRLAIAELVLPGPPGPRVTVTGTDAAVLVHTEGSARGVESVSLSHANLTSLIAQLAPLFPLGSEDRMLSVLPLHHPLELCSGLLLPLSRGTRVVYLGSDESAEVEHALSDGLITAVVGAPDVWLRLQREVLERVARGGPAATRLFDLALDLNRRVEDSLGLDFGRILFGGVHSGLGGRLRYLVSGGAPLDPQTHDWFRAVGLHLSEGYGSTQASPVVSVRSAGPKSRATNMGRAIPGVELRIDAPDETGAGEVLVRGPSVPRRDADANRDDGWVRTGDIGRLDDKGRLSVRGRKGELARESHLDTEAEVRLAREPALFRGFGRNVFGPAGARFFSSFLRVRVVGRALLPLGDRLVFVSNHQSELDAGLVRHALGSRAAHLHVMRGLDAEALAAATAALDEGSPVLLFAEGRPSRDGRLGQFRAELGELLLSTGVPVVPLWLAGTREVLPLGSSVPRGRDVAVHIGPPLEAAQLRTKARGSADALATIASVVREAVHALSEGRAFTLDEGGVSVPSGPDRVAHAERPPRPAP